VCGAECPPGKPRGNSHGRGGSLGQPTGILGRQLKCEVQQPATGGSRFPRRVRCERDVFEPRQGVIWANRLAVKHIKRGLCKAARPQSSNESCLVHEGHRERC
jgi:hypothetical protein